MEFGLSDPQLAAVIGGVGGLVLGLAARLGRFCTLGAIEDHLYGGSDHRLRMWGVAIGSAMLLSFTLMATGILDADATPYIDRGWNPIAHLVGGLVFGAGMALAGTCGFGALARLGGGDLRSFVIVLVMGISAYVAMSGPLAPIRLWLFPAELVPADGPAGYAHFLGSLTGLAPAFFGIAAAVGVLALMLSSAGFRAERNMIAWGVAVGAAIAFGWAGSAWLADRSFDAITIQNFSFAQPLGETILFAMTSSGAALSFAVGSVAGVWTGAFTGSLIKGHFRWEACEDPRELRRQIFGAILMGGGAVLAVGCTVGQGLSAISVLSFGAPITLVGIYLGVTVGLRALIVGLNPS